MSNSRILADKEKELSQIFHEDWFNSFINTKEINKIEFEQGINWLYSNLLQIEKPEIIYLKSPLEYHEGKRDVKAKYDHGFMEEINGLINDSFLLPFHNDVRKLLDFRILIFNIEGTHNYRIWQELEEGFKAVKSFNNIAYVMDSYSIFSEFSKYNFFRELGWSIPPQFRNFNKLLTTGVFRIYFNKNVVYAIQHPIEFQFNSVHQLHHPHKKAIQFSDGFGAYFINGRKISDEVFENISKENFLNETNEEIRSEMLSVIKARNENEGLLDFFDAILVDEKLIKHSSDYSEVVRLYKTKEKFEELHNRFGEPYQPFCWSEIYCPSTGRNYLLDNSADFTDALEALKFLRPSFVPENLLYQWKNFAN